MEPIIISSYEMDDNGQMRRQLTIATEDFHGNYDIERKIYTMTKDEVCILVFQLLGYKNKESSKKLGFTVNKVNKLRQKMKKKYLEAERRANLV
jgi:hypothetical protein